MTAGAGFRAGFRAGPSSGLSGAEVSARVRAGLANTVPDRSSRSLWHIVRANVLTLFNAIVGGSFVLLLVLGQWKDALFGFAAAGNAVIGVVQEYRAKRALDRLAVLETPWARVLRDGAEQDIVMEEVVLDDLLVLRAGDQVSADAELVEGEDLQIDESLLTGESDPVAKSQGMEVLSGSSVVTGQGTARVIRVGADSFANRLTAEAKRFSLVTSEIRNGINRILRWITWALLPVAAIVINGQMPAQGGWAQAITTGCLEGRCGGRRRECYCHDSSRAGSPDQRRFRRGGVRLARDNVLIQELAAVEGLARVERAVPGQDRHPDRGQDGFRRGTRFGCTARRWMESGPGLVWCRSRRQRHSAMPGTGVPIRRRCPAGRFRSLFLRKEMERRQLRPAAADGHLGTGRA